MKRNQSYTTAINDIIRKLHQYVAYKESLVNFQVCGWADFDQINTWNTFSFCTMVALSFLKVKLFSESGSQIWNFCKLSGTEVFFKEIRNRPASTLARSLFWVKMCDILWFKSSVIAENSFIKDCYYVGIINLTFSSLLRFFLQIVLTKSGSYCLNFFW